MGIFLLLYPAAHPVSRPDLKLANHRPVMLNGIWMLNSSTGWAVGNFGTIWHSSDQPLPIELLRFTAQREPPGVRLHWQTATEHNNAGFYTERSADLDLPPGTHYRLTDRLGILKRTAPLTDNRLDLSDLSTGIYCLWLHRGSTEARVVKR